MRALRLLPACLLALAACTVDTDSLKAKTDAECAAVDPTTKACGYKCVSYAEPCGRALTSAECAAVDPATKACGSTCVSTSDPAVGCAAPDCTPCRSGPMGEHATCAAGACSYVPSSCPLGQVMCTSGCADLLSAPTDCGACDHACPTSSTCAGGVCAPLVAAQALSGDSVRDITCGEHEWVFFYDTAWTAWFTRSTTNPTSYYPVDVFAGPYGPSAWLASPPTIQPYAYLAGSDGTGTAGAIWEYDSAASANIQIDSSPSVMFTGLALSDRWVYWTGDTTALHWVERSPFAGSSRLVAAQDFAPMVTSSFRAVATVYSRVTGAWHAFAVGGGAVAHLEEIGGVPSYRDVWSLGSYADRIAATESPSGALRVYLGDSMTGRVWHWDEGGLATLIQDATGPTGRMNLVADVNGAYWTVYNAHQVMEYRASDGALFPLADGTTTGSPFGICLGPWPGYVAWSDAQRNLVNAVLK